MAPEHEISPLSFPYRLSVDEVAHLFKVDRTTGLSSAEASKRLNEFGPNDFTQTEGRSLFNIILDQFINPMVMLLLAVVAVSLFIGHVADAAIIGGIILINAAIGAFQERKAEKAMESIRNMAVPTAKVRRDGNLVVIPAREVVPGDVVVIDAGDRIPADSRLVESARLQIDESLLTGESNAVFKTEPPLTQSNLSVGDQLNMVFMGTHVLTGRGQGICVATGNKSELGKISGMLAKSKAGEIPLKRRMNRLTRQMAGAALLLCLLIFGMGMIYGESPVEMLLAAMTLAVAAIPEGLPAVITISLSLGALRLSQQGILVRRLPAVEALGSITVICADKTGTLTENRMTVVHPKADHPTLSPPLLQAMVLCNDAHLAESGNHETGDPMEVALLRFAAAQEMTTSALNTHWQRIAEIPFDTERKRMTTVHQTSHTQLVCMKGAPESVFPLCRQILKDGSLIPLTEENRQQLAQEAHTLASQGFRVLAFAYREMPNGSTASTSSVDEHNMIFLGLIGLQDPPRIEVNTAIADCRASGIRPIMITGDHVATACAIGRELGIYQDGDTVIEGASLKNQDQDWLTAQAAHASIFARVSPEDKLAIIEVLKKGHEFVAMTGDGVNDAPALKSADVGLAMGRGTDVAKEAASLILIKEDFSTIAKAVKEGRIIYDNMRKFVRYMIATNLGEITTMLFAGIAGFPVPLLPVQILWINLMTDGLPAIALGFEPEEGNVMKRPPRPTQESIMAHGLWQHTLWVGILMGVCTVGIILYSRYTGQSDAHVRTMAFSALAFAQMGHLFAIRSEYQPLWRIGLWSNYRLNIAAGITIVTQLLLMYIAPLRSVFHTIALPWMHLVLCAAPALIIYILVEIEKALRKRWA